MIVTDLFKLSHRAKNILVLVFASDQEEIGLESGEKKSYCEKEMDLCILKKPNVKKFVSKEGICCHLSDICKAF